MSLLTDTELNTMRAAIGELLPSTCDILSLSQASDGQGGQTDTWATATASVSCRLDYKRGDERVFGATNQPYTGFMLSVPWDTTITQANRVKVGSTTYNITMVDNNKSWSAVLRCMVEAI